MSPDERCEAFDSGRQCRKKKTRSRKFCLKHKRRYYRNGGETRTRRELESIKAKARIQKLRQWRNRLLGVKEEE